MVAWPMTELEINYQGFHGAVFCNSCQMLWYVFGGALDGLQRASPVGSWTTCVCQAMTVQAQLNERNIEFRIAVGRQFAF